MSQAFQRKIDTMGVGFFAIIFDVDYYKDISLIQFKSYRKSKVPQMWSEWGLNRERINNKKKMYQNVYLHCLRHEMFILPL